MLLKNYSALIISSLLLAAAVDSCHAGEGLFWPERVRTPFTQAQVLSSIVRITENIYWDTIVLNDQSDVDTLKSSFKAYEGSGRKTYLPQGAVLWHVVITKDTLAKIMADPASPYEEGYADIAKAFRGVTKFPAERIIPISGWASATFISPDGLMITNYHVTREQIEALGRTKGCAGEVPAPFLHAEVAQITSGRIVAWVPLRHLYLVANLSSSDWHGGLDGALLRTSDRIPHGYMAVRKTPPLLGEPTWLYGFPFASARDPVNLTRFGYENANKTLRVSIGSITAVRANDFVVDADGYNGDSGGPVVDRSGAMVGYVWNVYPDSDAAQRWQAFRGGMIAVIAEKSVEQLRRMPSCHE